MTDGATKEEICSAGFLTYVNALLFDFSVQNDANILNESVIQLLGFNFLVFSAAVERGVCSQGDRKMKAGMMQKSVCQEAAKHQRYMRECV